MRSMLYALTLLPAAAPCGDDAHFVARLNDAYGDYQWDTARVISVDFDRDGTIDRAALGLRTNDVAFLLQLGTKEKPIVAKVPWDVIADQLSWWRA